MVYLNCQGTMSNITGRIFVFLFFTSQHNLDGGNTGNITNSGFLQNKNRGR
jgi:hypothetical protein